MTLRHCRELAHAAYPDELRDGFKLSANYSDLVEATAVLFHCLWARRERKPVWVPDQVRNVYDKIREYVKGMPLEEVGADLVVAIVDKTVVITHRNDELTIYAGL